MHEPYDTAGMPRPHSEEISHLINGGIAGGTLLRETFGKLATITLALLLEHDEIRDTDATITTDAVRHDLAPIQQLVQVRSAHPETLGGLSRGQRDRRGFDHGEVRALTDAAAHTEQHVSQLGSGSILGELRKSLELFNRNARSLNGLHDDTYLQCRN